MDYTAHCRRRRVLFLPLLAVVLFLPYFFDPLLFPAARWTVDQLVIRVWSQTPSYEEWDDKERNLPQHNTTLPFPEGGDMRMLRFGNQMYGIGLNNQLQELLLNTLLANMANRSYIFTSIVDTSTQSHRAHVHTPFSKVVRLPLSALIDSPSSGAPYPSEYASIIPRSVSRGWYEKMCPESKRLYLDTTEVNKIIEVDFDRDEALVIFTRWAAYLGSLRNQCVEIREGTPRVIDYGILGNRRLVSIWDAFSSSPVATNFFWSSLVLGALEKNEKKLFGTFIEPMKASNGSTVGDVQTIPGLITLHVRRLDFEYHCKWMSGWAIFEGWNLLPFLLDSFSPSQPSMSREEYMVIRCWIEIPTIVSRLASIRSDPRYVHMNLNRVFVSTNDDGGWINHLKGALQEDGWGDVASTTDIELNREEGGVDSAIDMEIASRGEVFIGNGFSSFSSTIVQLRVIRSLDPNTIRHW